MNPLLSALVAAGVITQAEAERINRQLDPDAARQYAENALITAFRSGLDGQQRRILDLTSATEGRPAARQLALFWDAEDDLLWNAVGEDVRSVALERAVAASINTGSVDTWNLVNEAVLDWVDGYYLSADAGDFGSIPNLNLTSKTQFAQAFLDWQRGELETAGYNEGLPTLIRALEPTFGLVRAEAIGVTETTRVFSETELAAGNANPDIVGWIYNTANDQFVSDICRPAESTVMLKGETTFPDGLGPPPRHVRCRSNISAVTQAALVGLRAGGLVTA